MDCQQTKREAKTVSFLLPGRGSVPVGGYRVVYEYANGLANRGWNIRIFHPYLLKEEDIDELRSSVFLRVRGWLGHKRRLLTGNYRPDNWFKVSPGIDLICTQTPQVCLMKPSDVWVATYWYTAKWVSKYSGARIYLIQHLETWDAPEAAVMATWKLPLRKVVISRWLQDVAIGLGELATYVPNGLNFQAFGSDNPPERRDPFLVSMLYHKSDWKGSADGLKALHQAKSRIPDLKAIIFSIFPPPPDLPNWVEYHQNPPQGKLREIYNRAAIFLSPSWTEGWPLPPAEALQCAAALAATDIGGHREYAHHGETALLSPPKEPGALAENVVTLMENQDLRIRLARQGHAYIKQFTWDRAVTSFEFVLDEALVGHLSKSKYW